MTKSKLKVRERNGGIKGLQRKLRDASAELIEVGVIPSDPKLARIANHNEFGTSRAPARPFMRQGLDGAKKEIADSLERAAGAMLDGVHPKVAISRTGVIAADAVKTSIITFSDPPNSPATVAKKGFNDPLIGPELNPEGRSKLRKGIGWRLSPERVKRLRQIARGQA